LPSLEFKHRLYYAFPTISRLATQMSLWIEVLFHSILVLRMRL